MDIPTVLPPRLKKGDTVAIVAPAGTVEQKDEFNNSVTVIERMGFQVRYEESIFQPIRYLAGDDYSRAEKLMLAFEDDAIKAIMGLRGGYGCSRLIPHLQFDRLRHNPKLFTGFSDLTTLHLLFGRYFGWITFHGPMAAKPGIGSIPTEQESHLLSLWTDPGYKPILKLPRVESWNPGRAEGRLTGGCLSTIISSIGTPYEIDTDGAILFLEDVGEPPYRLDRMITHLNLAGKFQSLAGILLGNFHDCEPAQGNYSSRDVLKEILQPLQIPILANFPAGHGSENWAIPLGIRIRIDADAQSVEFLESAVR
jgi:muramoyltetrapeptide carboxypeptidase